MRSLIWALVLASMLLPVFAKVPSNLQEIGNFHE
jgi:hypothetical protein